MMIKKENIKKQAQTCHDNVKKKYKLGMNAKWGYYFAKYIITGRDVPKITINDAPSPKGNSISRQIPKNDYIQLCLDYIKFIEHKKRLPNYLQYKNLKIRPRLLTIFFANIIVNNKPSKQNIDSKCFTKPNKNRNEVYDYFVQTFGKITDFDSALLKIKEKGYGHYFNGKLTNKQVIYNLKHNGEKPNCTDVCQMLWWIAKALGYDVRCIHVQCNSGEGHVFLKLRHKKNTGGKWITRDGACVISQNNKPITCVWCEKGKLIDENPSWFMENLKR